MRCANLFAALLLTTFAGHIQESMGATVEILQVTNISSKVAAIGGLPKSVRISAVSGDGSVVVGKFRNNQPPNDWQIFRYKRSSGIENLGTLGKEKDSIEATCISTDGMVIWGTFYIKNEGSHIFRYTQENVLQDLGTLGRESVAINGVSGDGSVIVGSFLFTRNPGPGNSLSYHAFSYSQSKGVEDLGTMGTESAFARGISDDGSLVIGNFQLADTSSHAFRYSRSDGVQDLGVGGVAAFATGFSKDGSVIVGKFVGEFSFFNYTYYNHVFIYTKAGGVQKLGAMGGRSVGDPSISADGTRLIGGYIDSDGESYTYTAKLVFPITQENRMIRIKFSNGTSRTYRDTDTLSVRSAISDVSKGGYEKTRNDPPEWSKLTPIKVKALSQGITVSFGDELVQVESLEEVKE